MFDPTKPLQNLLPHYRFHCHTFVYLEKCHNVHIIIIIIIITIIIIIHLLTYYMEQSPPWKANRFSASEEIPRTLWNPHVHYRIQKCPPPVPVLSHIHPVHTTTSNSLKIHDNIILPSMSRSPKLSLSLRFPLQNPIYNSHLPHTPYMPRPSHFSRFDQPNNILWAVQISKLLIM